MTDDKLIRKRASYKGQLTTFSTYLNGVDNADSLEDTEINELQLRISRMEVVFERYDEVQLLIEGNSVDEEILNTQLSERTEFESLYYKLISRANICLSKFKNTNIISNDNTYHKHSSVVKLPTIQLPKFSGNYENWLEFHDTFLCLIHSNSDMNDINKFHYLRASLEGSAAVVIQSLEVSSLNYNTAWQLLCDRYNNKRLLTQNHISALFNLEIISKESSFSLKRLIDQTNRNLRALETLGEPTKHWDTLLIYIISHKLDSKTYREWEECKGRIKDSPITFDFFISCIQNRADLIETIELSRNITNNISVPQPQNSKHNNSKLKTMTSIQSTRNDNSSKTLFSKLCPLCNGQHFLMNCSQFLALSNEKRLELLSQYKVCYNCLRPGHYSNHCKSSGCKVCKRKHNTLIHITTENACVRTSGASIQNDSSAALPVSLGENKPIHNNITLSARDSTYLKNKNQVLLATSLIRLYDNNHREYLARAVLDSGSTSCLITERLSKLLNLETIRVSESLLGINNSRSHISEMCCVPIKSLNENFSTNIFCFILPYITDDVPSQQVHFNDWNLPSNLCLADPHFHTPSSVDLIIGADVFWDLLGLRKISLGNGKPVLFESRLGWLVSGPVIHNCDLVPHSISNIKSNLVTVSSSDNNSPQIKNNDDIQNLLTRFWHLEEVSHQSSIFSEEEKLCEENFIKNTTRLSDGRFCVRIPLKKSPELLGGSLPRAKHCLLSLERRFKGQPKFKESYINFMSEYLTLGDMSECTFDPQKLAYFLPHHGVIRESSLTTKLRVVFNASSPTTSGKSLNDLQLVGPNVQDDLLSILLRCRQHRFIISADVEKMYRRIVVHPDDRHLQQIVWRSDSSEPIKMYQLNTVTYGTSSAPYLATRCLRQIGIECKDSKISEIIMHDFFVDDLLSGGDSLEEVLNIRNKVSAELASAGMNLRKWKSNEPQIISNNNISDTSLNLNIGSTEPCKTLGLCWLAESDELYFSLNKIILDNLTKRGILSVVSQIFDPIGLLAPCVIPMKVLMQKLWLYKLGWDDPLPSDIIKCWLGISKDLSLLNNLRIPRTVLCNNYSNIDLHIFCDASQIAYGACLYIRSENNNNVLVRLLTAKSRVAPIKPTTIPRLELCAALLGVHLFEKVISSLRLQVRSVIFWSDSTIVLGWLKMLPNRLQTFVRNRVAEILEKTSQCTWRHVPTHLNPADYISRGVNINSINNLDIWWSGPAYLKGEISGWPINPINTEKLPETRSEVSLIVVETKKPLIDFNRFSNLIKLQRSMAYVLRFINICIKRFPKTKFLNNDELTNSLNVLIKLSQQESFDEYDILLNNKKLPPKCSILKFNPFLDNNKILRVGGRLSNSNFTYDKKFPILIQSTNRFTKLLFNHLHNKLKHAGPQLLLASVRESYWPIGGRNLARVTYHKCVICRRMGGKTIIPIMGNLPPQRLSAGFPFENIGLDYAGPILTASRQGRGCKLLKVYIAIFVCFTTKSIHLEIVSDLTSNSFLLALRRFISRRGKPTNIFSDNGTSFVGAYNDLSKFLKANCNSLSEDMAQEGINFHFIPAHSPHFAGLAEAGVKSTKHHLIRVLGNCHLSYELLYTTLVEIEAILNSRPLVPLSSNPEDMMPLTPGHFLIGRPLISIPAPNLHDISSTKLSRFQRVEQLRQHFWARWSKEYISELQIRTKWRSSKGTLNLGSLVVLKDDNLPPLKWRLGRVTAVYPGADGVARVADIKTSTGILRRCFSKICPLPTDDDEEDSR